MTRLDDKMVPLAKRMLEDYGKLVTIKVPIDPDYNPETGAGTEAGFTDYSRRITPPDAPIDGFIPADLIERGDMRTYIAADGLGFTLKTSYQILIDGQTWRIQYIAPIYSGDEIALYELLLRH